MSNFASYDVRFHIHPTEGCLVARGYIRNESNHSFNTVVFRAKIIANGEPMGSSFVTLHGFQPKSSKPFEVLFPGARVELISKGTQCEIIAESAF